MSTDTGGPAFPDSYLTESGGLLWQDGMTLLDWFAGQIAGCLFAERERDAYDESTDEEVAVYCYQIAEAMLAEKRRRE